MKIFLHQRLYLLKRPKSKAQWSVLCFERVPKEKKNDRDMEQKEATKMGNLVLVFYIFGMAPSL